jgi:hypothetical protein
MPSDDTQSAERFCRTDPRITAASKRTVSDLQAAVMRIARREDLDFDIYAVDYRALLNDLTPERH